MSNQPTQGPDSRFIRSGPQLPVNNLQATINYYRETLGFFNEWTEGEKDGGLQRDEMRLLFTEDPSFCASINNAAHRLPLLWFVKGIETIYEEFQQRGIVFSDTLRVHPYGLREFAFIDINGYYIRVAEPVA